MHRFVAAANVSRDTTPLDAWRTLPGVMTARWESMRELLRAFDAVPASRVAVLGYPSPRAAIRLLRSRPQTRAAAFISPVRGYSDRITALAKRLRLGATLLTLDRDPRASLLRAHYFDLVIARLPIDLQFTGTDRLPALVAEQIAEMLRIAAPHALLAMHMTVRTGLTPDDMQQTGVSAASLGQTVGSLLARATVERAGLATSLSDPAHGTIELMGWARRRLA